MMVLMVLLVCRAHKVLREMTDQLVRAEVVAIVVGIQIKMVLMIQQRM